MIRTSVIGSNGLRKFSYAVILLYLPMLGSQMAFAASSDADKALIRAHYAAVEKSLAERDAVAAMTDYAKDVVIFDLGPPLSAIGHDASVRSYDAAFSATTGPWLCKFFDTRITVDHRHAYVMSFVHLAFTAKDGKRTDLRARITNIFEKQGNKWVVVHEHTSAPTDLASGKAVFDAPAVGEGKPFAD